MVWVDKCNFISLNFNSIYVLCGYKLGIWKSQAGQVIFPEKTPLSGPAVHLKPGLLMAPLLNKL